VRSGEQIATVADRGADPVTCLPDTGQPSGGKPANTALILVFSMLSLLAMGVGYACRRRGLI
jgi:hypothetical protein